VKVTTEELERCEVLLTIEVDPAHEQDLLKKAARRIARQVQIPGFRPGKAPYNTVVRRFGMEAVQQEVLENSVEKIIQDGLVEAKLVPYAQLSFDEISWDPFTLRVKVPGPPKVELSNYRDIRLEVKPVEVSEDDVNQALEELREQNATWAPVDRAAELNDLISMSVIETDGDEILADHDSVDHELVRPEQAESESDEETPARKQPDLTTPLLGLSAGDEKTFSVTYPEDFQDARYAGKDITFEVKVSSVKVKELDPLDDEFAQAVSDFETLAELREDVGAKLKKRRETEYDQELGQQTLDKIIEDAKKIEWPLALEEQMIDDELERFAEQFRQAGLPFESYLKIQNKTRDELREEVRESTLTGLNRSIVLGELAGLEKLEVSNTEVLERAKSIADAFGGNEDIWRRILASEAHQSRIANEVLSSKVLLRLAAIAKGEAPELVDEVEVSEAQSETLNQDEKSDTINKDDSTSETTKEPAITKA